MNAPEKISLWDRWFNRYRKEIHARGAEEWRRTHTRYGAAIGKPRLYVRDWIEYKIIDRVTGSETISREYLNR